MPRIPVARNAPPPDAAASGAMSNTRASLLRTITQLLPYLWPAGRADLKGRVTLALAVMVAGRLVTVGIPLILGAAVDQMTLPTAEDTAAIAAAAISFPLLLLLLYGGARILAAAFQQLQTAIFAPVSQNAQRSISVRTFKHMHELSLRFHLARRTGGLSRIIDRGTSSISFFLRFVLFNIVPAILELLLVCAILVGTLGWSFAGIVAVTIIFYIWFTFGITEWRTRFRREMNDHDTDSSTKAVDSLLNFETVKYFGNEAHEAERFDRAMAGYEKAAIATQTSLSVLNFGQTLVFTLGMTVVMLMSAWSVAQGEVEIGAFVVVNGLLIQLYVPLNLLGFVYHQIRESLVDMEKMFDVLEQKAEVVDAAGAKPLEVTHGHVRFEGVEFHYDQARAILRGIDFEIGAGQTVAVVGPTGAGKSTLSRLLFRFYDVSAGRITIDGQEVRDVTQTSLREAIGMVPQDTVLFNDTIRYNIAYGCPGASDEDVIKAAKLAQIHDFIESLPDGYDSLVGERGLKLSGGEKQRVAIARTMLKNPPILILDEATSALDTHTERDIQDALNEASKGRTTLIIAHRLSTGVGADEIIVLDNGRICERGPHEELLSRGGVYAALWRRQLEAAEAAERLEALSSDEAVPAD